MRLLLLAIAGVFALPLTAATRYAVTIGSTTATVLVDGPRRRIDFVRKETPFMYDVLLSDDGGATHTALNTQMKTWFAVKTAVLIGRPRIYVPLPYARNRSVRNVVVTPAEEPAEPIDGYAAHKYVVKLSFTIRESIGELVDEKFGATILVWTTDAIDPALAVHAVDLTTGIAEVDALLVPALAKISGFPLKTTYSATRAFTGGPPQTFVITAAVSDIRNVDAPPHAFERPADYVNQPPVIGAPGR